MLPTDERFTAMTQEEIIREFWRIYYYELQKTPAKGGGHETEFEGSEEFMEEMERIGLTQTPDGRWVEVDPDEVEAMGEEA